METFETLFVKLEIDFSVFQDNKDLFEEAFTHRSAVNERSKLKAHNERLEFLGDAVLELVTTEFLYKKFEDKPEGDLTALRSALVKKENLALVARKLDIGNLLKMSKGEARSGGREKDYLLANLIEAFIGALYLSQHYKLSKNFIERFILCELDDILKTNAHIDAKSKFQEITQGDFGITPTYNVISESGKDHDKTFVLGAFLNEITVGEGTGGSKKEAQVAAASNALENKESWENKFPKKQQALND